MILEDGQKIKQYLLIDHCNEGAGYQKPRENEEFISRIIYHGDHDEIFIQHRRISDGFTIETINVRDVAVIEFMEKKP